MFRNFRNNFLEFRENVAQFKFPNLQIFGRFSENFAKHESFAKKIRKLTFSQPLYSYLPYHVSCLLCILSPVSCITSPVSCLPSRVSGLMSPVTCPLSNVSLLVTAANLIDNDVWRKLADLAI